MIKASIVKIIKKNKVLHFFVLKMINIFFITKDNFIRYAYNVKPIYYRYFKKILIIEHPYPGLGDHLFCSHLPRIAKQNFGFEKVYISNYCKYTSEETKKLVWEINPYVDGFINEHGYRWSRIKKIKPGNNLLDEYMLSLKMDDGLRCHVPEVYYEPKIKNELIGKNLYDPNYASIGGDYIKEEFLDKYLRENNIRIDCQMSLRNKSVPLKSINNFVYSKDLYDFCDIIFSCNRVYCLLTGTETLADALKKPATVFCYNDLDDFFGHSPIHKYVKIKK